MRNIRILHTVHNSTTPAHEILHHLISYSELTIVIRGHLDYYVDGIYTPIDAGDAVYIPPSHLRRRLPTNEAYDYISFNFETDAEINLPVHIKNALNSEELLIIDLFDKINGHYYSDNDEKISNLLACLISLLEDRVKIGKFSSLTADIISYINANLNSKITLKSIADMMHFSSVYCDSVFKREVGQPIIDFLIEKRIDQSKKLLMNQRIPLKKIPELVGFSDYNYFSRIFKKRTGLSPSTYRKIGH